MAIIISETVSEPLPSFAAPHGWGASGFWARMSNSRRKKAMRTSMDEINWMQQNINAAQDATETLQSNVQTLRERGYSEEQIRNMSPDEHNELANAIRTENDNNSLVANGLDPDTMTDDQKAQALYALQPDADSPIPALLGALGSVGGFMAGAFGLSIGNGTSSNPTTPTNNANAEPLVGRRREDEESGERDSTINEPGALERASNWLGNAFDSVVEFPGKIRDTVFDSIKERLIPNIQIPTNFFQPGNLLNPNNLFSGINLGNWFGSFNAEAPSGPGNLLKIGNLFDGIKNVFGSDSSNSSKVDPSNKEGNSTNEKISETNDAISSETEGGNSSDYEVFSARDASDYIIKSENIQAFKESVLSDYEIDKGFKGNNGFLTEKKLLMLEMSGVSQKEIAEIEKSLKEKGYKKPVSDASKTVINEFKRILERRPLDPDPVFGKSSNTEEALSKVDFKKKPLETESKYITRVGEEIHRATQGMTFDSQEALNLHIAKVAEKVATIGDSIKYGNNTNGPFDTRPMNMVGDGGYKYPDSGKTDCNRFVASVLYTSGFFPPGAFSNLNQDVYLTPDDAKRRNVDFIQTSGGVVFLREASLLFEKVGDNLTHSSLGKLATKESFGKEPFVGAIGITRQNFTSQTTLQKVLKSDHVYIITEEGINPFTKKPGFKIAESYSGNGIAHQWKNKDDKYFLRSEFYQMKIGVNSK